MAIDRHPLPILNISEHLTRLRLQKNKQLPFGTRSLIIQTTKYLMLLSKVIGALLGTQNGREVEIVNTFQLAVDKDDQEKVDHAFLASRRDQCAFS